MLVKVIPLKGVQRVAPSSTNGQVPPWEGKARMVLGYFWKTSRLKRDRIEKQTDMRRLSGNRRPMRSHPDSWEAPVRTTQVFASSGDKVNPGAVGWLGGGLQQVCPNVSDFT